MNYFAGRRGAAEEDVVDAVVVPEQGWNGVEAVAKGGEQVSGIRRGGGRLPDAV